MVPFRVKFSSLMIKFLYLFIFFTQYTYATSLLPEAICAQVNRPQFRVITYVDPDSNCELGMRSNTAIVRVEESPGEVGELLLGVHEVTVTDKSPEVAILIDDKMGSLTKVTYQLDPKGHVSGLLERSYKGEARPSVKLDCSVIQYQVICPQ